MSILWENRWWLVFSPLMSAFWGSVCFGVGGTHNAVFSDFTGQSRQSHMTAVSLRSVGTILVSACIARHLLPRLLKLMTPCPHRDPECWMRREPTDCPALRLRSQRTVWNTCGPSSVFPTLQSLIKAACIAVLFWNLWPIFSQIVLINFVV